MDFRALTNTSFVKEKRLLKKSSKGLNYRSDSDTDLGESPVNFRYKYLLNEKILALTLI